MDTLTHALSGALAARATHRLGARLSNRNRIIAGMVAAAFPDSDFALRLLDPLVYLELHRGPTHSLLLLPLWAFLLAHLLARLLKGESSWRDYFGICALGIVVHIAGDVITSYGTRIFYPASEWRAALHTTFIIDPVFTGIIVAGLLLSLWRRPVLIARMSLAILAAYVGFQAILHQEALQLARDYVTGRDLNNATAHALPQPLSPFYWKLLVTHDDHYHQAFADLSGRQLSLARPFTSGMLARLATGYLPVSDLRWQYWTRFGNATQAPLARRIWDQPGLHRFRHFAVFPALYDMRATGHRRCGWFTDLRFKLPSMEPPFRFGMCEEIRRGHWVLDRLR